MSVSASSPATQTGAAPPVSGNQIGAHATPSKDDNGSAPSNGGGVSDSKEPSSSGFSSPRLTGEGKVHNPQGEHALTTDLSMSTNEPASPTAPTRQARTIQEALRQFGVFLMTKTGQFNQKPRVVVVRMDALYCLKPPSTLSLPNTIEDNDALADRLTPQNNFGGFALKRVIPTGKITGVHVRSGSKVIRLALLKEHDLLLSSDYPEVMKKFVRALDKALNVIGVLVKATNKPQVDFKREDLNLIKDAASYTSIKDKLVTRWNHKMRSKAAASADGNSIARPEALVPPFTLLDWDNSTCPLPPSVARENIPREVQDSLAGINVVMVGEMDLYKPDSAEPVKRTLAFSPYQLYICHPRNGDITFTASVYAIERIEMDQLQLPASAGGKKGSQQSATAKVLVATTIHMTEQKIPSLTFALPTTGISANRITDAHAVALVIAGYPARLGYDVLVHKGPVAAAVKGGGTGGANDATSSRPRSDTAALFPNGGGGGQQPESEYSVDRLKAMVPDYRAPFGDMAKRFHNDSAIVCRQVMRLTSRRSWEPRIFILTDFHRIVMANEKGKVRRTLDLSQIRDLIVTVHCEGNALTFVMDGVEDMVIKMHPDLPKGFTPTQLALLVVHERPDLKWRKDNSMSKDQLRVVLARGRNLQKGDNYLSPSKELKAMERGELPRSPSRGPVSRTNSNASMALSNNNSLTAPLPSSAQNSARSPPPSNVQNNDSPNNSAVMNNSSSFSGASPQSFTEHDIADYADVMADLEAAEEEGQAAAKSGAGSSETAANAGGDAPSASKTESGGSASAAEGSSDTTKPTSQAEGAGPTANSAATQQQGPADAASQPPKRDDGDARKDVEEVPQRDTQKKAEPTMQSEDIDRLLPPDEDLSGAKPAVVVAKRGAEVKPSAAPDSSLETDSSQANAAANKAVDSSTSSANATAQVQPQPKEEPKAEVASEQRAAREPTPPAQEEKGPTSTEPKEASDPKESAAPQESPSAAQPGTASPATKDSDPPKIESRALQFTATDASATEQSASPPLASATDDTPAKGDENPTNADNSAAPTDSKPTSGAQEESKTKTPPPESKPEAAVAEASAAPKLESKNETGKEEAAVDQSHLWTEEGWDEGPASSDNRGEDRFADVCIDGSSSGFPDVPNNSINVSSPFIPPLNIASAVLEASVHRPSSPPADPVSARAWAAESDDQQYEFASPISCRHFDALDDIESPRPDGRKWIALRLKFRRNIFSFFSDERILTTLTDFASSSSSSGAAAANGASASGSRSALLWKATPQTEKVPEAEKLIHSSADLLKRYPENHRGVFASQTVSCICADTPAVFCVTMSTLLNVLCIGRELGLIRHDSINVRTQENFEWLEVSVAEFVDRLNQGLAPAVVAAQEMSRLINEELANQSRPTTARNLHSELGGHGDGGDGGAVEPSDDNDQRA